MLRAACVGLALTLAACGARSRPLVDGPGPNLAGLYDLEAFMTWVCEYDEPITFINAQMVEDPLERAVVLAHEASHEADALATGSCASFHERRGEEGWRLAGEVRAFCASWAVRVRAGQDPDDWLLEYAYRLTDPAYSFDLGAGQALSLLAGMCRP